MVNTWLLVACILACVVIALHPGAEGYTTVTSTREWKVDRYGKKNGTWRVHVTFKRANNASSIAKGCSAWSTKGQWVTLKTSSTKPKPSQTSTEVKRAVEKLNNGFKAKDQRGPGQKFSCSKALIDKDTQEFDDMINKPIGNPGPELNFPGEYVFDGGYFFMGVGGGSACASTNVQRTTASSSKWNIQHMGGGYYKISVAGCDRSILQDPAPPTAPFLDQNDTARWRLHATGQDVYVLESGNHPGNYLDVRESGALVVTQKNQGMHWRIHT